MKSITAIVLTLATLSAAAPNPIANANPGILSPRQGCSYACLCQADNLDPGPDPDTATCCTGGTLDTGRTTCSNMNFAVAQAYVSCCGDTGGYTCTVPAGCSPIAD